MKGSNSITTPQTSKSSKFIHRTQQLEKRADYPYIHPRKAGPLLLTLSYARTRHPNLANSHHSKPTPAFIN